MDGDKQTGGFDPATEVARKLVNMDSGTLDRTMRMFTEMRSKNQTLKDINEPNGASCETASVGRPLSGTHRDLLRRREELERQMHRIQENLRSVHRLLSAFED